MSDSEKAHGGLSGTLGVPGVSGAHCSEPLTMAKRMTGFAKMTPEQRREIASAGGRAAHASGRAHRFTSETARAAGKRSSELNPQGRFTSETAREAGRRGGMAATRKRTGVSGARCSESLTVNTEEATS